MRRAMVRRLLRFQPSEFQRGCAVRHRQPSRAAASSSSTNRHRPMTVHARRLPPRSRGASRHVALPRPVFRHSCGSSTSASRPRHSCSRTLCAGRGKAEKDLSRTDAARARRTSSLRSRQTEARRSRQGPRVGRVVALERSSTRAKPNLARGLGTLLTATMLTCRPTDCNWPLFRAGRCCPLPKPIGPGRQYRSRMGSSPLSSLSL